VSQKRGEEERFSVCRRDVDFRDARKKGGLMGEERTFFTKGGRLEGVTKEVKLLRGALAQRARPPAAA